MAEKQQEITNEKILQHEIYEEMKRSYIDYSMSVIVARALPDVRDGLKPVHRRILYGMSTLGNTPDKPHKKSARIVGEVMGKYHPHGDSSIYDAMVRLAQPWNMRYPLVDGHGNFGSMDGDGAAASRYTEARMAPFALEMLRDIDKDTVDFAPNYDGEEDEPVVLPARFPNLLVNGSNGIAVGMATSIPPHNLREVIKGTVQLIAHPDMSSEDLMKHIKGPDFPTGATIVGRSGIRDAYTTGQGKVKVRAKAVIEEGSRGTVSIIFNEIPYGINKASMIERIAELVRDKKLRDRMRIVMSAQDEDMFKTVVGKEVEMDWEATPTQVLSRRILITKSEFNGVPIGRRRLHAGYNLNATRVNRAGMDLVASPNLRLQMGDRLTVVGNLADINRLAEKLGNSMKRLHEPNMITIFVGIIFGLILGSLNLGYGIKLGIAGGPLIVAILLSRFGYKIKLTTYTSSSASLLMRELGICLFLASVGIAAGKDFAATVFNSTGAMWVLWGFVITVVPLLIVGCFARWKYKINILTLAGVLSGSYTDPPALAYATNSTNNDEPAVAYSTVYPLTMFLRVVVAQLIVLYLL